MQNYEFESMIIGAHLLADAVMRIRNCMYMHCRIMHLSNEVGPADVALTIVQSN